MPLMICRVFPYLVSDGPGNMGRDEAILDEVATRPGAAIFRTYGWAGATLSLGYFQPFEVVAADPRWQEVSVVRRPTGGGAICHEHEITYALVVPRAHHF